MNKAKKIASHLRFITRIHKNWEFYINGNDGIFINKVRIMTVSGFRVFTKPQLETHIERVRGHLRDAMRDL